MELVVDTQVLFAFFHPTSSVEERIKDLTAKGVELLVPRYMFDELLSLKPTIKENCELSEREFIPILAELLNHVEIAPKKEYEQFLSKAEEISPDSKDVALFALALSRDKIPIWSREPRLKKQQSEFEVLNDEEVAELFDL